MSRVKIDTSHDYESKMRKKVKLFLSDCAHASAATVNDRNDERSKHKEPKCLHDGDSELIPVRAGRGYLQKFASKNVVAKSAVIQPNDIPQQCVQCHNQKCSSACIAMECQNTRKVRAIKVRTDGLLADRVHK